MYMYVGTSQQKSQAAGEVKCPQLDCKSDSSSTSYTVGSQVPPSIEEMQRSFGIVVTNTMKSLQSKVTTKDLASSLLALGPYEAVLKGEKALLHNHKDELFQAESVADMYSIIHPYMSFFNPELLDYMIETHGTQEDREKYTEYEEKLNAFCQSITVLPMDCSNEKPSSSPKRGQIKIKLNLRDRRLKCFRDIKSAIAKILHVKKVALCLDSVHKGCTEMVFMVPSFVIENVFPLTEEQLQAISSLGVFNVTISTSYLYNNFDVSIVNTLMFRMIIWSCSN